MKPYLIAGIIVVLAGGYLIWASLGAHWPYDFYAKPSPVAAVQYTNNQYGLAVALPASWQGFSVVTKQWEGWQIESMHITDRGELIKIRHPLWTITVPREDLPIMVFTHAQWQLIQEEKLSVGAAPIPPSELARNSQYVFALPARYNYDFNTGWEEVQTIIDARSISAFEPTMDTSTWKTYTNDQYGFEFQYPGSFMEPGEGPIHQGAYVVTFVSLDDLDNYAIEFIVNDKPLEALTQKSTVTIRGISWQKATWLEDSLVYSTKNIQVLVRQKNHATANQILSTFRFTTPDATADWKTYTNTQYGFSLQYSASLYAEIPPRAQNSIPGQTSVAFFATKKTDIDGIDVFLSDPDPAVCTEPATTITFGANTWYRCTFTADSPTALRFYHVLPDQKHSIVLGVMASSPLASTLSTILSTFQFSKSGFTKVSTVGDKVYYQGSATVSGEYRATALDSGIGAGSMCFFPDAQSATLIPQRSDVTGFYWFCFSDPAGAKAALHITPAQEKCDARGTATVTISDYVSETGESELPNMAKLISVISANPPTLTDCQ